MANESESIFHFEPMKACPRLRCNGTRFCSPYPIFCVPLAGFDTSTAKRHCRRSLADDGRHN